jgi:hypothetical protein
VPLFCLDYPTAEGEYRQAGGCAWTELVSGDAHDGVHRATVTVPQGAAGGDWNLRLLVADRAGSAQPQGTSWLGPDLYQRHVEGSRADPHTYALPDQVGRVPVSSDAGSQPPSITEITVTPAEVDSRTDDHLVRIAVHAGDPDGDLQSVHGFLSSDGSAGSPSFDRVGTVHVSGDGADGWWNVDFVVPQGTPPGTYYLQIAVKDAAGHTRSYLSRSRPWVGEGDLLPGPGTVIVTS